MGLCSFYLQEKGWSAVGQVWPGGPVLYLECPFIEKFIEFIEKYFYRIFRKKGL
jgi:hypothetical protein